MFRISTRSFLVSLLLGSIALWAASPAAEQWFSHVKFLASDDLQGRGSGTPGHHKAAEYVADQFKRAGLKPLFSGSYLQPVSLRSRRVLREGTSVDLIRTANPAKPQRLALGDDYGLIANNDLSPTIEAPLVFIGYGLYLPEAKLNDLVGKDLKGKIVVYIEGAPSHTSVPVHAHASAAINRRPPFAQAGAIGYIAIPDPAYSETPWDRASPSYFQPALNFTEAALDDSRLLRFGMVMNPAKAATLFEGSERKFSDLMRLVELGKPLPHFELPLKLRASIRTETQDFISENVAATSTGTEPVYNGEYALITAHLDHLGVGAPVNGDAIYNGAVDNASGVATLIEIAKSIGAKPTRRGVVFAALTAGEDGMLGSQFLAAHPGLPRGAFLSNLNIDAFLPLYPLQQLTAYGMDQSTLGPQVERAAKRFGIRVEDDPEPKRLHLVRGDQYSFIRIGVPAVALDFGYRKGSSEDKLRQKWMAERYHSPADDINQPLDLEAAEKFTEVAITLAREFGDSGERPRWNSDSFFARFKSK